MASNNALTTNEAPTESSTLQVPLMRRMLLATQVLHRRGYYVNIKAYTTSHCAWRFELWCTPASSRSSSSSITAATHVGDDDEPHVLLFDSAYGPELFGKDASSMTPVQIADAILNYASDVVPQSSQFVGLSPQKLRWLWWYDCVLEAAAPKGFYSEFDDYGGFQVYSGTSKRSAMAVSFEDAEEYLSSHGVPHPFITELSIPDHVASKSAAVHALVKAGRWEEVVEQVRSCPDIVQYPVSPPNACNKGELIGLGASVHKRCADGTPAEIAKNRGNTELLALFKGFLE
ncbi:hypothetical protein Pelo_16203 [Pelomyxa schiedti]|nr:hypothetical protein Pelo_16203 [Pelomyxa schiedti]